MFRWTCTRVTQTQQFGVSSLQKKRKTGCISRRHRIAPKEEPLYLKRARSSAAQLFVESTSENELTGVLRDRICTINARSYAKKKREHITANCEKYFRPVLFNTPLIISKRVTPLHVTLADEAPTCDSTVL